MENDSVCGGKGCGIGWGRKKGSANKKPQGGKLGRKEVANCFFFC